MADAEEMSLQRRTRFLELAWEAEENAERVEALPSMRDQYLIIVHAWREMGKTIVL